MTILRQPTRAGVRDAAEKIARVLPPTPMFVCEIKGVAVAFKAESLQPVGAFKIRGACCPLLRGEVSGSVALCGEGQSVAGPA